jgi:hypothetical protein
MGCGASANSKACPESSDVAKNENSATTNAEPVLAEKPSQGEPVTAAVQGSAPAVAVVDTDATTPEAGKEVVATSGEPGVVADTNPPEKEAPAAEVADPKETQAAGEPNVAAGQETQNAPAAVEGQETGGNTDASNTGAAQPADPPAMSTEVVTDSVQEGANKEVEQSPPATEVAVTTTASDQAPPESTETAPAEASAEAQACPQAETAEVQESA